MLCSVSMSTIQTSGAAAELLRPAQRPGMANLKPWPKGVSGNPGGGVGEYHEARRLCAAKTAEAVKRLFELMASDDERVSFMAVTAVLERGIGKPRDHSNEPPSRIDLSALTPEERQMMARLLQKVMGL